MDRGREVRRVLLHILTEYFGDSDLRTLCFNIDIDYEDLPGSSKSDKARELVSYAWRHKKITDVINEIRRTRPEIDLRLAETALADSRYSERNPAQPANTRPTWHMNAVISLLFMIFVVLAANRFNNPSTASNTEERTNTPPSTTIDSSITQIIAPTNIVQPSTEPTTGLQPTPTAIGGGTGTIAFTSDRDWADRVYLMDSDGSRQRRFDNTSDLIEHFPSWSPDGSQVIFMATSSSGTFDLYLANSDGSGTINISGDLRSSRERATWSPGGIKLAFTSPCGSDNREICIMNSDGSEYVNVTNNPSEDYDPAWSPAGDRIAFVSERDGNAEIYIMYSDGSGVERLTNNPLDDVRPAWSPDGTRIAFSTLRDGNREIYVMDNQGQDLVRLTNSKGLDTDPAWSPDGTLIAFSYGKDASCHAIPLQCDFDILVMNADGSNTRSLTSTGAVDTNPAWQPR